MCGQSDAMRTVRDAACQLRKACSLLDLFSHPGPARALMPDRRLEDLIRKLDEIE